MSSRRTLILIGALLVGGLAAFLTLTYVRGVENRAGDESALVDVVVASTPIAKGQPANDTIAAQTIDVAQRPRKTVPANAVRRLADIEGQVAAIDLGGGEVVTTSMFGSTAALTGSKAAALDKGNVAITVAVDSASVSGGLIQPGDLVNLLVRYKVEAPEGDPAAGGGGGESPTVGTSGGGGVTFGKPAGYVMQGVKVFAVGTDAGTTVASTAPPAASAEGDAQAQAQQANTSTSLTVQLPPEQAALLASVRDAELYATLVPPDYEPRPIPLIVELPALPGELGETPYPSTKPNQ